MKYIQRFVGRNLSLGEGLQEFIEADKIVREELPDGAIVVPQTHGLLGALTLDLSNGTRLVVQYEIQRDAFRADLTLQYEES